LRLWLEFGFQEALGRNLGFGRLEEASICLGQSLAFNMFRFGTQKVKEPGTGLILEAVREKGLTWRFAFLGGK